MNKTQWELVSRLVNRFNTGGAKQGWTLTNTKDFIFLRLQKLNEINQSIKLSEKYPDIFESHYLQFKLSDLKLIDDSKARELLKKYEYVMEKQA